MEGHLTFQKLLNWHEAVGICGLGLATWSSGPDVSSQESFHWERGSLVETSRIGTRSSNAKVTQDILKLSLIQASIDPATPSAAFFLKTSLLPACVRLPGPSVASSKVNSTPPRKSWCLLQWTFHWLWMPNQIIHKWCCPLPIKVRNTTSASVWCQQPTLPPKERNRILMVLKAALSNYVLGCGQWPWLSPTLGICKTLSRGQSDIESMKSRCWRKAQAAKRQCLYVSQLPGLHLHRNIRKME